MISSTAVAVDVKRWRDLSFNLHVPESEAHKKGSYILSDAVPLQGAPHSQLVRPLRCLELLPEVRTLDFRRVRELEEAVAK